MSNFHLRLVSAVILAGVALGLTYFGGAAFRVLAVAVGGGIFIEWCLLSGQTRHRTHFALMGVVASVLLLMVLAGLPPSTVLVALAAGIGLALASGLVSGQGLWGAGGIAYAVLPVIAASAIRGDAPAGLVAVLFLFAVVWATDIFAYFVGRLAGGPKLAPAISPGKTWSGAVGGVLFAVVAGLAVATVSGLRIGGLLIVSIVLLSAVSQIGDLFESWLKRHFGAKDSSNLIPGHGGVMDRVDGLVAAVIGLYLIGVAASGPNDPLAAFGSG
ncbi:phosphatidate cytidylyltransferase [Nitratireductor sp. CAU 1489]|uniref:Phosphatidate cytidylyltransferase n=1 Tax=Nitratireductor arenosus TaxID=2682096 RepID=A0A844QIU3_9HYPH|nr:phosphatidate cytidylyltransferase [Nitratireductor arenosus]MVA97890.1 phosphatidate cytidylyltransferase [Nitratireductor arenosus]